jgi:hypothetical protein
VSVVLVVLLFVPISIVFKYRISSPNAAIVSILWSNADDCFARTQSDAAIGLAEENNFTQLQICADSKSCKLVG